MLPGATPIVHLFAHTTVNRNGFVHVLLFLYECALCSLDITVQYSSSMNQTAENQGNFSRGIGFQNGTTLDYQEMLARANWFCILSDFHLLMNVGLFFGYLGHGSCC
jgi:hypothetical protein